MCLCASGSAIGRPAWERPTVRVSRARLPAMIAFLSHEFGQGAVGLCRGTVRLVGYDRLAAIARTLDGDRQGNRRGNQHAVRLAQQYDAFLVVAITAHGVGYDGQN